MDKARKPIACLDVAYAETSSAVACVLIEDWREAKPAEVRSLLIPGAPNAYDPGAFYLRELPLLLRVLEPLRDAVSAVVVDGYVWLDADENPGLGGHLFAHLGEAVPVVGVAKTKYRNDTWSLELLRAGSSRPLWITSAGLPLEDAAANIKSMTGDHRIPTILKTTDHVAREQLRAALQSDAP